MCHEIYDVNINSQSNDNFTQLSLEIYKYGWKAKRDIEDMRKWLVAENKNLHY